MTASIFLTLLTTFVAITTTMTECIKEDLIAANKTYSGNLLATIVGCSVGICGTGFYYLLIDAPQTIENIAFMIFMGPAVSLSAMGFYDKIKEGIMQITKFKK